MFIFFAFIESNVVQGTLFLKLQWFDICLKVVPHPSFSGNSLKLVFCVSGVLVGNKSDLSARREVQASVAQEWAQSQGLDYHETSAVSLHNIESFQDKKAWLCLSLRPHLFPAERDGELRRAAPQFSPSFPLSLRGTTGSHPEPESRLNRFSAAGTGSPFRLFRKLYE